MSNNTPFIMTSYDISYEPIYTKYHKQMPEELKNKYEDYILSLKKRDTSILNELETISKKYNNPVVNNLLYNCLIIANRHHDAIKIAEHNFNTFPDYLFGRLNYASTFILKDDYKSIPRIFNYKFDLKLIEPNRNKFHISEVLSFHKIMHSYHLGINEYENAKKHYDIICQLDIEGKVKKELSTTNFIIKQKKLVEIILSILISPFILIYMIYDVIKKTIKDMMKTKT